jgi:UDP-N-acetylglucosamine transferase subunit ALG13
VDILILITLGTQDKPFYRLLEAVQKQIDNKVINEEVIVQAGCSSDFKSKDMKILDLIPMDEFDKLIEQCDLLITHGGVGSIITGLKNNKKVIAAARLEKFKEHVNDHQLQIIENFSNKGYILSLDNFDELDKTLKEAKTFKPNKYKSNTNNFIKLLKNNINK